MVETCRAIYTEKTQCRDCYKCVRECPVKAIRVRDSSAVVDHTLCIFCGKCVHVCPSHAKKVRDDIARAERLIRTKSRVIVSLAPSYPVYFTMTERELVSRFRQKGVAEVSETAIGAGIVAKRQQELISSQEYGCISSACPVIVELVEKYYPQLSNSVSPLHSPMCAHAAYLRSLRENSDCGIIFIGPCIAKKEEADRYSGLVDVALTFEEAEQWLHGISASADGDRLHDSVFYPAASGYAAVFPLDGGMISAMSSSSDTVSVRYACQSGTESVIDSLKHFSKAAMPRVFCEYLACHGGCINGPGMVRKRSVVENRIRIVTQAQEQTGGTFTLSDELIARPQESPCGSTGGGTDRKKAVITDAMIEETLVSIGKGNVGDRKDCGGCGYNTCRDFAAACIRGTAEAEMCVTEMRKIAQRKAHVLMKTIPLGIVIIDAQMTIIECNTRFLSLFGDFPEESLDDLVESVPGVAVGKFCTLPPLSEFSEPHLVSGAETIEHGGRILNCQYFTVQPGRLFGALFQDITLPAIHRDTVIRKAQDVIRKNLESTQKIAGLLGETAAETEIILNSLIDAFDAKKNGGV